MTDHFTIFPSFLFNPCLTRSREGREASRAAPEDRGASRRLTRSLQLLVRQTHLSQKGRPAGIRIQAPEHRVNFGADKAGVTLPQCPLEPLKGAVMLPEKVLDARNLIGFLPREKHRFAGVAHGAAFALGGGTSFSNFSKRASFRAASNRGSSRSRVALVGGCANTSSQRPSRR